MCGGDYLIIGYDFFGSVENQFFDTAIPTSQLDSVILNGGIYDELFISLDTTISKDNKKYFCLYYQYHL